MKKVILLSLTTFIGLWFTACDKEYDGPTVIQGQVVEFGTGVPVSKATIYTDRKSVV